MGEKYGFPKIIIIALKEEKLDMAQVARSIFWLEAYS